MMPLVFAVDPGLKVAGTATFVDGVLASAELVKSEEMHTELMTKIFDLKYEHGILPVVVCEKMHVYARNQFAAKAMVELSVLAGWLRPNAMYTYQQWAGSLKEEILWERIPSRLSTEEKAVLPKRLGPHKDVLAAVGIGLHHLGRLKPRSGY